MFVAPGQALDSDELASWTNQLTAKLRQNPMFTDLSNDLQWDANIIRLELDRQEAARLGFTAADLDQALYDAFGQRQISDFLKQLETTTLPTDDGRDLTVWAAVTGIIMPLYSEDYWPYLSQGLTDAFAGDGSLLMLLADTYNDRGPGGEYQSNLMPANVAISCLDGRASSAAADIQAQNEKVLATSKVLGRYWQFGALTCEQWPYPVTDRPADYSAEGSAPILVIGTTGDPATPYQQAVSLANEILDNAALLTYDGEGHTIYGQGVSCIDNAVDDYLLNGKLPEANKVCD